VYVGGVTSSPGLNTSGANLSYQGREDGLLRQYSNSGLLLFSTYLGGSDMDRVFGVYSDATEHVVVVGDTNSTDFKVTAGQPQTLHNGKGDGFMVRYSFYLAPSTSTFDANSTQFLPTNIGSLTNVPNVTLVKSGGKVRWQLPINVTQQNFDSNVKLGSNFVSMNVSALDPSLNSSADISFTGMDCYHFTLYYATGFFSTMESLINAGRQVATQVNVGHDCDDPSICTNVKCANGVLNFTAQHFDGFGGGGGAGAEVPEFSTWALLVAISATIAGLLYARGRGKRS
jgi:hypothetical protein